ncbi:MAG TPA: multi antimicrobial extrusion protein MatE, partial [Paenibacillaceae bacterium]
VDFCQGLMMLRNQTNILIKSQGANVLTVIAALSVAIAAVPEWNGRIGALAMSAGYAAELTVLLAVLRIFRKRRQLTTP